MMSIHNIGLADVSPAIDGLRMRLQDPGYINQAVEHLAWELSLDWLERSYGLIGKTSSTHADPVPGS
jgi:hypothetical protein